MLFSQKMSEGSVSALKSLQLLQQELFLSGQERCIRSCYLFLLDKGNHFFDSYLFLPLFQDILVSNLKNKSTQKGVFCFERCILLTRTLVIWLTVSRRADTCLAAALLSISASSSFLSRTSLSGCKRSLSNLDKKKWFKLNLKCVRRNSTI